VDVDVQLNYNGNRVNDIIYTTIVNGVKSTKRFGN